MTTRYTLLEEFEMARGERDLEFWDREFPGWEERSAADFEERFVSEVEFLSHNDTDFASDDDFEYAYGAFMESVFDPDR
jgi:broad specificity phosphatase PhoE